MHTELSNHLGLSLATILGRILGDEQGKLPVATAQHILNAGFSDDDRSRMHELAVRNQQDALSAEERDELFDYVNAGTVLSILKSTARRTLNNKANKRKPVLRAWIRR